MADPLSIAASIAGLVSLAGSVFQLLCQFGLEVKNCKDELNKLRSETRRLSVLLHDLSLLATSLETEPLDSSFRLEHVDSCERTLYEIKTKLETPQESVNGPKSVKIMVTRLKWPYTSKELQRLLAELARHKETISLALSADSMKALLRSLSRQAETLDGINDIREAVREIKTRIFVNEHRQKVLDFFMSVNPQLNLETSLRLRHPMTGLWLTESDEFRVWMAQRNGKLWMSGIPGAGKTVLAGSVIEEALKATSHITTAYEAVCFFFCDYKDPKSLELVNLLSSIASQLARQNNQAYLLLEQYYGEVRPDKNLPKPIDSVRIRDVLVKIFGVFDRVLLIVDGLDECGPNSPVVTALSDLVCQSPPVSMALMSRDELHIREALESDFEHIDVAAQGPDVRRYVREELEERIRHRKLRLRSPALKEAIINTLIEKAGGMFRWVSCQLDYLCELPMDKDRREALSKLPPTLNATYERILSCHTHPSAIHIISTSLRLLAIGGSQITIQELCDAVSGPYDVSWDEDNDRVLEEDIIRYCSSLLRKSADMEHFEFAHFTVREFLESPSLLGTPLKEYYIRPNDRIDIIDLCLQFLLMSTVDLDDENLKIGSPFFAAQVVCERRPFYRFAAWQWPFLDPSFLHLVNEEMGPKDQEKLDASSGAFEKVLALFAAPDRSSNFKIWAITFLGEFQRHFPGYSDHRRDAALVDIANNRFGPLNMACALTLPRLVLALADGNPRCLMRMRIPPSDCLLFGLPRLFEAKWNDTFDYMSLRWMDQTVTLEAWVDAIAAVARKGLELPGQVRFLKPSVSLLEFILRRHGNALSTQHRTDPTVSLLKLLRAGCRVKMGDIVQLRTEVSRFCVREQTNREGVEDRLKLIADEFEKMCDDRAEIEEMRTVLNQTGFSLTAEAVPTGTRHEALSDIAYGEMVRGSVRDNDISALHKYSTDSRFKLLEKGDSINQPLLHLAVSRSSYSAFQYLLDIGCDDSVRDYHGNTVWHLSATEDSPDFNGILRNMSLHPEVRQLDVNHEGHTPIHLAMSSQNYQIVRELLPLCRTKGSFVGSPSLWTMALEGEDESATLISDFVTAGVPEEEEPPLIHRVLPYSNIPVLKELKMLWPGCCDERYKEQLPIERLLDRLSARSGLALREELINELLPSTTILRLEVFRFICSNILPRAEYRNTWMKSVSVVLATLADLPELPLTLLIRSFSTYIRPEGFIPSSMRLFDEVVHCMLTTNLKHVEENERPGFLQDLLHLAAYFDWAQVSCEALALGSSVHEHVQNQSALEVACLPNSLCSQFTFSRLLANASPNRLDDISTHYNCGLIFLLLEGEDKAQKLEHLLSHGAGANVRHPVSREPAVIYHLRHESVDTAKVLLQHGASHQSSLDDGFDVLCGFIWNDLLDELRDFRDKYPQIDWNKTFRLPWEWAPKDNLTQLFSEFEIVEGCTMLHLAVFRGSWRCFRYLLEEKLVSDVNAACTGAYTCAHFIAMVDEDAAVPALTYLQSRHFNINALNERLETPLDIAFDYDASLDMVDVLLSMGAKGTNLEYFGRLDVKEACEYLSFAETKFLMCPSPNTVLKQGMIHVLARAVDARNLEACRQLASAGCPLNLVLPTCGVCPPLLHALHNRDSNLVSWLLDNNGAVWSTACEKIGWFHNPVSLAAADPNLNGVLRRLVHIFRDLWPEWLLESPCAMAEAICSANIDGLNILIEFLKEKYTQEITGNTPSYHDILETAALLSHAALKGNIPAMEVLLNHGADINLPAATGKTALYYAAGAGKLEAVEFLLAHGASPTSVAPDCLSLVHLAAEYDDLELLKIAAPYYLKTNPSHLDRGLSSPLSSCRSEECVQYLLTQGLDPGTRDELGISPLHAQLSQESLQTFILQSNLLISYGANQYRVNIDDIHPDQVEAILNFVPRLLRVLGKASTLAMFPSTPPTGSSALCMAAQFGDLECCRSLVSIGADVDFEGHYSGTPLAVAIQYGETEVARFLIRAGAKLVYFSKRENCYICALRWAIFRPGLIRWVLVERYIDQRKIAADADSEPAAHPRVVRPWSGSRKAQVPLVGKARRRSDESLLDYVIKLEKIKRSYWGRVIYYE